MFINFLPQKSNILFYISVCRLNEIACQRLDQLEESYPIICAPTEQVFHVICTVCVVDSLLMCPMWGWSLFINTYYLTQDMQLNLNSLLMAP